MKEIRKWTIKGVHIGKQGKKSPRNQESQRKEERCGSTRKIIIFWINHDQGVREWTKLIHLGLVG
jgi:hypothetical protein